MIERLTWRMVRFTGLHGGPAYCDLSQVAAVLDTAEPHTDKGAIPQLAVARGATIYLKSGAGFYVHETADVVFEEVHRYRTEIDQPPRSMKMGASAPSPRLAGEFVDDIRAPGEAGGRELHDG